MTWQPSEKYEKESKTKLGFVNFSMNLEKHGGDTGSSQEAGSWGSSHLRRLKVGNVSTKRYGPSRQGRGQLTKPADEELVASPAALEAAEPAAPEAELAAPDAELAALEAALEADSPTLEADEEASEAALEAEAPAPPTPKIVVAAEVVMVESPEVMVVAKDEVVMALEDSVAEPLSVAEPEAEPVAEPVAEGVPDCGCVRLHTCRFRHGKELTMTVVGMSTPAAVCHEISVFGPVVEGGMYRWGAAHHLHLQ